MTGSKLPEISAQEGVLMQVGGGEIHVHRIYIYMSDRARIKAFGSGYEPEQDSQGIHI